MKNFLTIKEANKFLYNYSITIDKAIRTDKENHNYFIFNYLNLPHSFSEILTSYFYTDNLCVRYFSENEIIIAANEIRRIINMKAFL